MDAIVYPIRPHARHSRPRQSLDERMASILVRTGRSQDFVRSLASEMAIDPSATSALYEAMTAAELARLAQTPASL